MAESPDEVYQRVLSEEQAKGSSPQVAEGRAKSARVRAQRAAAAPTPGPAAQQPAAAAQPPAEQPAAEQPAAEQPAAEQPAAEQPAAQQPAAAAPAASAAPAGAATVAGEDPEAAYSRVLAEEQSKGSSPPVAEARAKAARMRARKGAAAGAAPAARPAPAPAAAATGAAPAVATAAAPQAAKAPAARAQTAPDASPERIQRLLAVVKPEAIQRVEKEPMDRVNVWPHLMAAEFLAILGITAFLVIFSTFVNAPFRELANINVTPNPSKAPWYFLGLQELLRYFHPQVAGVTIPQWIILGLMVAPFIDRNPSNKPQDRKLAISFFTIFILMFAVLGILGSLFRGPGFNFVYPWDAGIFFEL